MSNIIGFSKGLYSSWFYYAPARSLFDCGEGCASFLGNKVNAVQNIFLSHDHNDHIAGLLTFIAARQSGMISKLITAEGVEVYKPLNIYFPNDPWTNIWLLREYINKTFPKLSFQCQWIAVKPGDVLPNNVVAFQTDHYRKLSLGYKVVEQRNRLKKEYIGQDIGALIRSKKVDRADINEEYTANSFVYMLDSNNKFDHKHVAGADTWIADTTFINIKDRDGGNTHMTLQEAVTIAKSAQVKNLICAHFSPRYSVGEIGGAISKMYDVAVADGLNIDCAMHNELFNF